MFGNNGPIVPPMKDVLGDSYAETRAEIEARERAKQAADAAQLAANEQATAKKKFPWAAIAAIVLAFVSVILGAVIFIKQTDYENLQRKLNETEKTYKTSLDTIETLEKENKSLKHQIQVLTKQPEDGTQTEGGETTDQTGTQTDTTTNTTTETQSTTTDTTTNTTTDNKTSQQ